MHLEVMKKQLSKAQLAFYSQFFLIKVILDVNQKRYQREFI